MKIRREVPSTDENVTKAYTGDWEPIGTTQTGEHVTDYSDGSADRNEIKASHCCRDRHQ